MGDIEQYTPTGPNGETVETAEPEPQLWGFETALEGILFDGECWARTSWEGSGHIFKDHNSYLLQLSGQPDAVDWDVLAEDLVAKDWVRIT